MFDGMFDAPNGGTFYGHEFIYLIHGAWVLRNWKQTRYVDGYLAFIEMGRAQGKPI